MSAYPIGFCPMCGTQAVSRQEEQWRCGQCGWHKPYEREDEKRNG